MDRLCKFIIPVLALLVMSGCTDDNENTIISFPETEISIDSEGGECLIKYETDRNEEIDIKAHCKSDWVHSFNYSQKGVISFYADKNESASSREADIEITSAQSSTIISVIQESGVFKVKMGSIEERIISGTITPQDTKMTYTVINIEESIYESFNSDSEFFESVISQYKTLAIKEGKSLEEYLSGKVIITGEHNFLKENLWPNTKYILVVFGLTSKGERLTDIAKTHFCTKATLMNNLSFDISVNINKVKTDYTITPSDNKLPYYSGLILSSAISDTVTAIKFFQEILDTDINYLTSTGKTLDEAIKAITKTGESSGVLELEADKDYSIFTFGVNEKGLINSEPSVKEFRSGKPDLSKNKFTVEVSEERQNGAYASVKTTNSDPYILFVDKKTDWTGKTDTEIMEGIIRYGKEGKRYVPIYNGDIEGNLVGLYSDSEYYCFIFGYNAGVPTTSLSKTEFRTTVMNNQDNMTFDFAATEITSSSITAQITPKPDGALYYCGIAEAGTTAEDIKDYLAQYIQTIIFSGALADRGEYMRIYGYVSETEIQFQELYDDTEYVLYSFAVSEKDGNFLSEIVFSEPIKTEKRTVNDLNINLKYDKYFDGNEIANKYPQYSDAAGMVVLPVSVEVDKEAAGWLFCVFYGDLMNEPDGVIINELESQGIDTKEESLFYCKYDEPFTMFAVAMDENWNYSKIFKQKFILDENGASPAEEFDPERFKNRRPKDGRIFFPQHTKTTIWELNNMTNSQNIIGCPGNRE